MANHVKRSATLALFLGTMLLPGIATGQTDVEVGPYVQFSGPHSAVVRWDTATACDSIVEYGTSDSLGLRVSDASLTTTHEIALTNLQSRTKYFYRVGYTDGPTETFTEIYWPQSYQSGRECGFDNGINYARKDCSSTLSPYPVDSLTTLYEDAADRIVAQTGITKGYCLVYGCREGRLAFEIAKRTDLIVVGVDTDPTKIDNAAQKLMQADVYGARVTVRQVDSLDSLPFTKYFANLIVSDYMISDGQCVGTAEEMFRMLRPSGGIAYLGQSDNCPSELTSSELTTWLNIHFSPGDYTITDDTNGVWGKVTRDPVVDCGWWSHQYGGAHNNGGSNDGLEGAQSTSEMDLQWIGMPGPDSGIDRNPRMPPPICNNGRLFHQGMNRLMAIDSYNGAILWSLEIPLLRRVNLPRDAGNTCSDDNYVYVAIDDDCWRLDGDTGIRSLTYKLGETGRDWGIVFRDGDNLYGSSMINGASYTEYYGTASWYAGNYGKVCSKYIFANNAATNTRLWEYPTNETGAIINTTVAIGGGRVYLVESRNSTAQNYASGRMNFSELWQDQYLVALNPSNGNIIWERPIDTLDGTAVFYLLYDPVNDIVVIQSSNSDHYLYAYDAANNGNPLWSKDVDNPPVGHTPELMRAVMSEGVVFLAPKGFNVTDGSEAYSSGVPAGECGTPSAAKNVILYRPHSDIWMWNKNSTSKSYWGGIRPGCWLNVIASGGMVLAPEGGGGCSCNGWFYTSVAFTKSEN